MSRDNGEIRVLRVISRLNTGGPARHVVILNSGLDPAVYRSVLVTGNVGSCEGDMTFLAREAGIDLRILRGLGREVSVLGDLRSFIQLMILVRRFRPHIVHTHASKAGGLGRIAAVLNRVPVRVHTFHGHVFRGYFGGIMTRLIIAFEKLLARFTTVIIAICPSQKTELSAVYRIAPESKIRVVPLGLELDEFFDLERNRGRFRRRLGIAAGVPLVVTAGRLVPIKNISCFLRAAKTALEAVPDARFAVVGDGELKTDLEKLSHHLGIDHAVHFTGWVKDMADVYSDADVLVQSSINEGTPVSVIEAMASGCCVVSTRAGGAADLIEDGRTGILVSENGPWDLAQSIVSVLSNRELRNKLGECARRKARRYRSERLIKDIGDLYLELLGRR